MSTGYIDLPVTGGGGGGTWGSITGTLADQTDLQDALDAKEAIYDWDINPDRQFAFFSDFIENDRAGLPAAVNAGGGTGQSMTNDSTFGQNTTENSLGVVEMILGTGTTARGCLYGSGQYSTGLQVLRIGWRAALASGLSDGTNTFTAYIGFGDNPGAGDMTDGVYFRYTHSVNSGKWEAVVADAGVRAAADTGVAPVSAEFQTFEIQINQAGTEALFYINGTLTNTVSSGLPDTTDYFTALSKIEKSAGATSRSLAWDWLYIKATRPTIR